MSDRKHTYEINGAPHIDVSTRSGDIVIRRSDDDTVTVVLSGNKEAVETAVVDATSDSVTVRSGQKKQSWFSRTMDVVISTPPGGVLRVGLGAGDVMVRVPMESVDVSTGAGDVRINEPLKILRVKVASGDLLVDGGVREASITSASGDIRVGAVDDIVVNTASGSVDLGIVTSGARIKAASGDIKVREFSGTELDIKTMSGDATIGIVSGMTVSANVTAMSGEFRNRIEPSGIDPVGEMTLNAKSFSGDLTLRSPW